MAVSIRDVAAKAGVSVGTVSHVLNGNIAARIAPDTQERVRHIARELGYRPNRVARSLGRRRTDTLGLLVGGLRNPFFVEILETVETMARAVGYHVLLEAAPSLHGTFGGYVTPPDYWPVDGVLMWATFDVGLTDVLGMPYRDTPVVYLGNARSETSDWVAFHYEQGGQLAAERLLSRGCHRIAYISPYAYGIDRHDEPRHRGFKRTCQSAGITPQLLLTGEEETRAVGVRMGLEIAALPKSERPDGVFCHNDTIAIGVCAGLRRAGLSLPDDIAVIGFDGIEEGLYLETPLTTVALPIADLCQQGLHRLIQKLNDSRENQGAMSAEGVLLSPSLREGGTA
jgi:DNA-binding LacI/PurR family transcriptional regulator